MSTHTQILETDRLALRHMDEEDAEFILGLLNEPSFLQYIGDKGVRTADDARAYIRSGPVASYAAYGHGLYMVTLKSVDRPIGMCGLVRRPALAHADIGYAFLPQYWAQGFAHEAARAVLQYGQDVLMLPNILAIVSPENDASKRILERLGMKQQAMTKVSEDAAPVALYALKPVESTPV